MRARQRQVMPGRQAGRAGFAARLRSRQAEIEAGALTRVQGISAAPTTSDPEYAEGLRTAVGAAIAYGLEGVEAGERAPPPVPIALLGQARLAARNGVGLDTVLRRYFAGYTLLGDFIVEEARREGSLGGDELVRLLRRQASSFDRLIAAISEEYGREGGARLKGTEQRRAEAVRRLLGGESLDRGSLDYDLNAVHLGLIAGGEDSEESIRALGQALRCRPLLVPGGKETTWAWLGGRGRVDSREVVRLASTLLPEGSLLVIGEPGEGLAGWRLTHHQAVAALPVAQRLPPGVVRYAEVALLAATLQDDLHATSLQQLYLEPLQRERDGGRAAKETLRAYFAAGRNVSSAAAALSVRRQTVTSRLRKVEAHIGRDLDLCGAEIEVALRLADLIEPNLAANLPSGRTHSSDTPAEPHETVE